MSELTNRELETRDPNKLIVITSDTLKKYPERRELLAKYYDKRADRPLDEGLLAAIRAAGGVHTPIFITNVEDVGDVVIAGRQRRKCAVAAKLTEVPVIVHSDDDKVNVMLELSENLARSQNSPAESAHAYRKALQQGTTQEEIAAMAGVTPAAISYAISIGDMPKVVHEWIDKGKLTQTAAIAIKKACGKKAPKGAGVTAIYDPAEVETFLKSLDEQARLQGDKNIKVKHANQSKANFVEGLSGKEWDALIGDASVPNEFMLLISVFRNKVSIQQAKSQAPGDLDWLRKIVPQPKPKPVKEPKVKAVKEKKGKAAPVVKPSDTSDSDLSELFS